MDALIGVVGFAGDGDDGPEGVGDAALLADEAGAVIVFGDDEDGDVFVGGPRQLPDHERFRFLNEGIDDRMEQGFVIALDHYLLTFLALLSANLAMMPLRVNMERTESDG